MVKFTMVHQLVKVKRLGLVSFLENNDDWYKSTLGTQTKKLAWTSRFITKEIFER